MIHDTYSQPFFLHRTNPPMLTQVNNRMIIIRLLRICARKNKCTDVDMLFTTGRRTY